VPAVEANLFAFFQYLSNWPRVLVHDDGDCVWTMSDLPFPLFNSVLHARLDGDRASRVIDVRMQSCRDRGVPMLWWTGPSTAPSNLGERLSNLGFLIEPAFGMSADLDGASGLSGIVPGDDRIAIERVGDRATLDIWSQVLCDGFGAPRSFGEAFAEMAEAIGLDVDSPFRHYLARVNGEPVATCSLFLGAGVAGIYDVSTLPERRRTGVGAAITRCAMRDARADGYRMAILHASQLGLGMYRSLGFETICDIGQHVWAPEGFSR
jgi:GNAT superfamily N-acetyltransferase